MEITRKETREVSVTEDIICNKCGKSTKGSCDFEYAHISANWGYDSRKDMQNHSADICEDCYDEFVASFKHPPYIDDKMNW